MSKRSASSAFLCYYEFYVSYATSEPIPLVYEFNNLSALSLIGHDYALKNTLGISIMLIRSPIYNQMAVISLLPLISPKPDNIRLLNDPIPGGRLALIRQPSSMNSSPSNNKLIRSYITQLASSHP
jgi:hypothetical protein